MLKREVDWVYCNYDINFFVVEQTSQKVNKMLCIRSSTETKRKNKRPIAVIKTGNRDEKTGPKLPTKIAPRMACLCIFLGTFSPAFRQNAHFCAAGKTLVFMHFSDKPCMCTGIIGHSPDICMLVFDGY